MYIGKKGCSACINPAVGFKPTARFSSSLLIPKIFLSCCSLKPMRLLNGEICGQLLRVRRSPASSFVRCPSFFIMPPVRSPLPLPPVPCFRPRLSFLIKPRLSFLIVLHSLSSCFCLHLLPLPPAPLAPHRAWIDGCCSARRPDLLPAPLAPHSAKPEI